MDASTQSKTLEPRSDRFEKVDGHWCYKTHDGIRLYQIFITYAPEANWPSFEDPNGNIVTSVTPYWAPPHTWMMWRPNASDEFLGALRRSMSAVDAKGTIGRTWNEKYGKAHLLRVWPHGEGMQLADLPLETLYPLPDGLCVRLPKEVLEGALAMGVLPTKDDVEWAPGKGKIKPLQPGQDQGLGTKVAVVATLAVVAAIWYFLPRK